MNSLRRYCLLLCFFVLPSLLLAANPVQAGVRYYILIFGAQTHPKIPRFTHTFCTIVRVDDAPPGCLPLQIEAYTISWLPQTMIIKPYRLRAEAGHNFTLAETLRWSAQHHMQISQWGPYLIEEDFYWKVHREYERFERGEYLYRAIDPPRRGDVKADCIHAVTDVDQWDPRSTYPVIGSGDVVTRKFVRILDERGRLFEPPEEVSWLNSALGLDCYPVRHRSTPRTRVFHR